MKQLSDSDIQNMCQTEFNPNYSEVVRSVRTKLHVSNLIPKTQKTPEHAILDFHQHTEEQAWQMLVNLIRSTSKTATIITGASGILKIKFQQWSQDSVISPYIISCTPINNGSFRVVLKKQTII